MQKTLRVLAVIAVVVSLVQVLDLVVEIIKPAESSDYMVSAAQQAKLHWIIYWPSGLVLLLVGAFTRKRAALLGSSLLIGGAYLMLLGNNGGIWAVGHHRGRLITSVVTLVLLSWITFRLDSQPRESNKQESEL